MKLEIGLTENNYDLTLLNVVQKIALEDTRKIEEDEALDGTVWFNVTGNKKERFSLNFTEIEYSDPSSVFKTIQQRSIPDYFLPVFVRLTTANQTNKYSAQTEFEGACKIRLINKEIDEIPTWRNFTLNIYVL